MDTDGTVRASIFSRLCKGVRNFSLLEWPKCEPHCVPLFYSRSCKKMVRACASPKFAAYIKTHGSEFKTHGSESRGQAK